MTPFSLGALAESDFDLPATETHVERSTQPSARFSMLDEMFVERGTVDDWNLLHDLHYKAEVLSAGSRFWRLDLRGDTIGVLVTANPRGMVKERHLVFPHIKPDAKETVFSNTYRYNWINGNIRVVSRFVVDTMYRGIGCGYRMMNLASRLEGYPVMEIQSSMSKFNLFGQKAGFRFVKPTNANKYETGMRFFRSHFAASPQDYEAIIQEIESLPDEARERMVAECKDFYIKNSALEKTGNVRKRAHIRVEAMDHRAVIKSIQQMSLASPMYGVWRNPDHGRALPERLALTAFDNQSPTEALVL